MLKHSNTLKISFLTGALLIGTIAGVLMIASLCFFLGIGVAGWQFPIAFVLTGLVFFYTSKGFYLNQAIFFKSLAASFVVIVVSVLIALFFYDVSYDGQSYHQEGIYQLKQGWNPFYELLSDQVNMAIYINHYSKGVELPQAALYSLIGHIEVGKATNFMLLSAVFCLAFSYLLSLNRLSKTKCILLSLFAAFNPIVINQMISTYVDGQLAMLLLCFCIVVLWINAEAALFKLLLLGAVIVITVNVKFTGLIYMVIFSFAYLAWLLVTKRKVLFKKAIYTILLSGAVAVIFVGYNPYVVNTVKFQHPFYPLMGAKKVDIMGYNTPNGLEGKNGASKFFLSLFSHTDNVMPNNGSKVTLKIPFMLSKTDVVNASKIDTRIAGFGPLFSGIILLSILLLLMIAWKPGRDVLLKNILMLLAIVVLSVAIMPESWWARYIPQLWLFPIIVLFAVELYGNKRLNLLKGLLYAALILNIGFTFIGFAWNFMMTSLVNYQIATLKAANQTIIVQWGSARSNRIRFIENKIPFEEKNLDHQPAAVNIIRSDSKYLLLKPVPELPKSKIVQWAEKFQKAE